MAMTSSRLAAARTLNLAPRVLGRSKDLEDQLAEMELSGKTAEALLSLTTAGKDDETLFKEIDTDKSGAIDPTELKTALDKAGSVKELVEVKQLIWDIKKPKDAPDKTPQELDAMNQEELLVTFDTFKAIMEGARKGSPLGKRPPAAEA